MIALVGILFALALGGATFAFMGGDEKTRKRVLAVAKPPGNARGRGAAWGERGVGGAAGDQGVGDGGDEGPAAAPASGLAVA